MSELVRWVYQNSLLANMFARENFESSVCEIPRTELPPPPSPKEM